ncbi:MAG: SDR family oxidoreductase [Propionibacteriales bacterium]|nr:SDR family oxidoreductase [Propionibacteriales bacterium]
MTVSNEQPVAIVTGAASGVGRHVALRLGRRGMAIVATDVNAHDLERTVANIDGTAVAVAGDITSEEVVSTAVETAAGELGRLDVIANVAGMAIRKSLDETTREDWYRMIDINLTSIFQLCQRGAAVMRDGGAIVNVSSVSGFVGMGYAAYCAAKGGVIALTKRLAVELGGRGIRVNSVAPGPIATPFTAEARSTAGVADAIAGATLLGRFAEPDEIAATVEFLASQEASFVTGHVLVADGGMTANVNLGAAAQDYGSVDE